MKRNTLFLIPDISGFTRFVTQTEIDHSRHIISELLELLIDANDLDLTLAEIEGDALLFFKKDKIPEKTQLVNQAQKMFISFHQHLLKYESHRICECGACQGAGKLSLKIVAHVGHSDFISVKGQQKPYGQDIILAHRLLKNNIDSSEYLLLTNSIIDDDASELSQNDFPWLDLEHGVTEYESFGEVGYYFSSLSPLHKYVTEPKVTSSLRMEKPIIIETYIEKSRDAVFEIIIDFKQRMKWNKSAKNIEYDAEHINQVGAKHVCVFDARTLEFVSVKADFGDRSLVYGEKILDLPFFAKDVTIYFVVGGQRDGCRVQIQIHYIMKAVVGWVFGPIFRKKMISSNTQALQHLKEYCEQVA